LDEETEGGSTGLEYDTRTSEELLSIIEAQSNEIKKYNIPLKEKGDLKIGQFRLKPTL